MDIRVLSDKKIIVKNHCIDVFIHPHRDELYETITLDIVCKKRKDSPYNLYYVTPKTYNHIIKKLSTKYGIKRRYFWIDYKTYPINDEYGYSKFHNHIKCVYQITTTIPDNYYTKWLAHKRDKTIEGILS